MPEKVKFISENNDKRKFCAQKQIQSFQQFLSVKEEEKKMETFYS